MEISVPLAIPLLLFPTHFPSWMRLAKRTVIAFLLALLSVLIALKLLGPIGMIVAVPILACGRVLVKRLYVERVLEGGGFHPILSDEPIVITVPAEVGLTLGPEAGRSVPGLLEALE